jgi:phosphate transport system protein
MRDAFHDDLDSIEATLVEMSQLVSRAMERATTALLTSDLKLAEEVISEDDRIDEMQHELDDKTLNVMARQQPVARDLRTLVTSLRMSADLERMGDLAHHIAKLARMRYPNCAVPDELRPAFKDMGIVATRIIEKVGKVIDQHDSVGAIELDQDDDEMDKLHRYLLSTMQNGQWPHSIEMTIDITLLGRYYERCADHAVSIAKRVYFLVNGEYATE